MVSRPTGAVRQLPGGSSAPDRRHGQREPFQGRKWTGPMETGRPGLLMPVRHRLDHDQEHLGAHHHQDRTRRSRPDDRHLQRPTQPLGLSRQHPRPAPPYHYPRTSSDRHAGGEDFQLLRRGSSSRRNPHAGKQSRRQRLPRMDGAQRQRGRWRRCGLRKVTGETVRLK